MFEGYPLTFLPGREMFCASCLSGAAITLKESSLVSGKQHHVKAKELGCLSKPDIGSEQGKMSGARCGKMESVKRAQRSAELSNHSAARIPSSARSLSGSGQ